MIEGNDLFGDGVNVAARLEGVAAPGRICISSSTFEQVKNKLSIGFEDMGPQEVKNIPHPVGAFQIKSGPISVSAGDGEAKTNRGAWGVESRRGAVAEAMRHRSVFSPRSSNRTCGFTASGSPTGFTSRHTVDCQFGLVSRDDTVARNQLSPCGRAPSEASGYFQVLQAHRQSPILGSFESVPEVRVLSSAGITRPHRSYDPVRLPPGPPCSPRRWRCDLRPERASPDYPDHLSNVPCPIPRWIGTGAYVGCFPIPRGLPRFPGGSASTISLSRPAQTSLALRPAGSLNRPRRPLSRGFETAGYPTAPLVSYQINRQLSGWYLPPLVIRAFGAHWKTPAIAASVLLLFAGAGFVAWQGLSSGPVSLVVHSCKIFHGFHEIR